MSILLILAIVFAVLTILTLAPRPAASSTCMLGYKALCPFSPISTGLLAVPTLILFVLAALL